MTETTTKHRSDRVKLRLCKNPPRDISPCLLPDLNPLTLNEGETKFQLRRRHRMTASRKKKAFSITKYVAIFIGRGLAVTGTF